MAPFAVFYRGDVKRLHPVVAVLTEVPLVQFFFFDLIAAARLGKGLEMTCRALNAAGLHMIIVAEDHGFAVCRLKRNISAAVRVDESES